MTEENLDPMAEDREGTTRGPRQDEALKKETEPLERGAHESRAEEWHEPEPPGEDQPRESVAPEGTLPRGTPPGMDQQDVMDRSELARWLQPSVFPADRDRLLDSAAQTNAPDQIRELLQRLPAGRSYENVQDLWRSLGRGTEAHRT